MMFQADLPLGGESGIIGNSVALRKRSGRVDWVRSAHLRVDLTFRDIPRPVSAIGFVPHIWAWWCKTVHSGAVRCIWIRFAHPRIRLHQVAWGCTGLHGVAQDSGCPTTFFPLAASRIDACWSATPQAGRAKTRAPSTTPQSCAIWTTIAHDDCVSASKTRKINPDSRKSFCALCATLMRAAQMAEEGDRAQPRQACQAGPSAERQGDRGGGGQRCDQR